MLKSVLTWSDAKFEEALDDKNTARGCAKAFGLGALEGALDACALLGGVCLVTSVVQCFTKK